MNKRKFPNGLLAGLFLLLTLVWTTDLQAQRRNRRNNTPAQPKTDLQASIYKDVEWRSIGPYRGGRSATVTGVPGKPQLFYMGSTGGGVWKTDNGGTTWKNISDAE